MSMACSIQTRTWWDSVGNPFPAPFDVDFHLLLNLAVGGNWPGNPDGSTVFPQDYVIDYVRVLPGPRQHQCVRRYGARQSLLPMAGIPSTVRSDSVAWTPMDLTCRRPMAATSPRRTGWSSGGTPGYFGGFGRNHPIEIADDLTEFRMWINPDAGQDYTLEINLQEDDNGDGTCGRGISVQLHHFPERAMRHRRRWLAAGHDSA